MSCFCPTSSRKQGCVGFGLEVGRGAAARRAAGQVLLLLLEGGREAREVGGELAMSIGLYSFKLGTEVELLNGFGILCDIESDAVSSVRSAN